MLTSFRAGRLTAWTNVAFWSCVDESWRWRTSGCFLTFGYSRLMAVGDSIKSTNFALATLGEDAVDYSFAPGIPTAALLGLTLCVVSLEVVVVVLSLIDNLM